MSSSGVSRKIAWSVFLIVALHAAPSGVQNHRYITATASIVENGRFALDERFGTSDPDFVLSRGERYPNMPPGVSLLLAPSYWVYVHTAGRAVERSPAAHEALFGIWAGVTVTAPMLALGAVLMFSLLRRFTNDVASSVWVSFGLIFGTPVFYYSTGIWSHAYMMTMTLGAFYLVVTRRRGWTIGATMGAMLLTEHQAPLPIALLGGFWLWTAWQDHRPVKAFVIDAAELVAGVLPFVAVLLAYNHAATGSILRSPVALWYEQNIPGEALFTWPTLSRLWGLTFSPFRGIFLYAPLTLLGVAAIINGRVPRLPAVRFSWVMAGAFFLLCVTYVQWDMGATFGPRYFTTALPFALMSAAFWPAATVRAWVIASFVIGLAGASTYASDSVFTNLGIFLYRGPFLHSLDYAKRTLLPSCCGLHLEVVTPFWPYIVLGGVLWLIWRTPRQPATPQE